MYDAKNNFHVFGGNWQCGHCVRDKFPFSDVNNDDLLDLAGDSLAKKTFLPEFSVDDKLKLLLSHSDRSNWYAHSCESESDQPDNYGQT